MTPHVSIKLLLTQSDDRLVRMTAAGHDRAFEAIVDRYRRPLLRYAERFPDAGPAEDVIQAAFVRAWGALRDGTEVRDLRPWLYRIVHNTALNATKRQRGEDFELIESEALGVGPEAEAEIQEELRRTLGGIAALPGRQREALVAVAVNGRAHADVGRELGITDTAVRQLVRRARASVRAVASALTPYPLLAWASELGAAQTTSVARIGEIIGGAGSGALALKLGAVAATGALVVGAPVSHHVVRHAPRATATAQATPGSTETATTASVSRPSQQQGAAPTSHHSDGSTSDSGSGSGGSTGGSSNGGDGHSFRTSHGAPPGLTGGARTVTGKHRHRTKVTTDVAPTTAPDAGTPATTVVPAGGDAIEQRRTRTYEARHKPEDTESHTEDHGDTTPATETTLAYHEDHTSSGTKQPTVPEGPEAPETSGTHGTTTGATGASGTP